MSRFRQDLYNFVESDDPYTVYKNDIPMIVKLPEFYEEDKMMDGFVKECRMDAKYYDNVTDSRFLIPMRKHHRKTKRTDQLYFWFQDSNKLVYRINIDPKNPLLHLFEREFAKDKVCLSGTYYSTRIRGQDYTFYSLNNWKFA
jgi:capsule polysaccharide modification protein KpsS